MKISYIHFLVIKVISQFTGSWKLKFPKPFNSFKISIQRGHVTIEGHPIQLELSTNVQFPLTSGWLRFVYHSMIYYIQFTNQGVKVVVLRGGKVVPAVVFKSTTTVASGEMFFLLRKVFSSHVIIVECVDFGH